MQTLNKVNKPTELTHLVTEDGVTHTVYQLPTPKNWSFRTYTNGDCSQFYDINHLVRKVRVSLFIDETALSYAVVVPYDEAGLENYDGSVFMDGYVSIIGVLDRLGIISSSVTN